MAEYGLAVPRPNVHCIRSPQDKDDGTVFLVSLMQNNAYLYRRLPTTGLISIVVGSCDMRLSQKMFDEHFDDIGWGRTFD